jgi:hypothetical protein
MLEKEGSSSKPFKTHVSSFHFERDLTGTGGIWNLTIVFDFGRKVIKRRRRRIKRRRMRRRRIRRRRMGKQKEEEEGDADAYGEGERGSRRRKRKRRRRRRRRGGGGRGEGNQCKSSQLGSSKGFYEDNRSPLKVLPDFEKSWCQAL